MEDTIAPTMFNSLDDNEDNMSTSENTLSSLDNEGKAFLEWFVSNEWDDSQLLDGDTSSIITNDSSQSTTQESQQQHEEKEDKQLMSGCCNVEQSLFYILRKNWSNDLVSDATIRAKVELQKQNRVLWNTITKCVMDHIIKRSPLFLPNDLVKMHNGGCSSSSGGDDDDMVDQNECIGRSGDATTTTTGNNKNETSMLGAPMKQGNNKSVVSRMPRNLKNGPIKCGRCYQPKKGHTCPNKPRYVPVKTTTTQQQHAVVAEAAKTTTTVENKTIHGSGTRGSYLCGLCGQLKRNHVCSHVATFSDH